MIPYITGIFRSISVFNTFFYVQYILNTLFNLFIYSLLKPKSKNEADFNIAYVWFTQSEIFFFQYVSTYLPHKAR